MANLFDMRHGDLNDFVGKLNQGGLTAEMAQDVRKYPRLVAAMVEALNSARNDMNIAVLGSEGRHVYIADYKAPSFSRLKKNFDKVSGWFAGRLWVREPWVGNTDETPGSKTMSLHCFEKPMTTVEIIGAAGSRGYRIATLQEALAFADLSPDFQRKFQVVVLGSYTIHANSRFVPVLRADGPLRVLDVEMDKGEWAADRMFLFVRQ